MRKITKHALGNLPLLFFFYLVARFLGACAVGSRLIIFRRKPIVGVFSSPFFRPARPFLKYLRNRRALLLLFCTEQVFYFLENYDSRVGREENAPKAILGSRKIMPEKSQYPIFPNGKILSFSVTVNLLSSSSIPFLPSHFYLISHLYEVPRKKGRREKRRRGKTAAATWKNWRKSTNSSTFPRKVEKYNLFIRGIRAWTWFWCLFHDPAIKSSHLSLSSSSSNQPKSIWRNKRRI